MEFNVGDRVLLNLGVDFKFAPQGLRRWDGCQFIVSQVRVTKWSANNRVAQYELSTCNSPSGMPYAILEEWLLPMR